MQSISRPVAETIMMMLRIIASQPPHTGVTLRAQPTTEVVPSEVDSSTTERAVTFFTSSVSDNYVIVREPDFDQVNYTGVSVGFVTNGEMRNVDYVGTDIANIGTDVFKFLAAP